MFEIETTNVFLENATQAQPSPSATLESTSAFTVTTMSNKADTSVFSTTAKAQREASSIITGVTKTSVTRNFKVFVTTTRWMSTTFTLRLKLKPVSLMPS